MQSAWGWADEVSPLDSQGHRSQKTPGATGFREEDTSGSRRGVALQPDCRASPGYVHSHCLSPDQDR